MFSTLLPARYRVAENPLRTERRAELLALMLLLLLVLVLLWGTWRIAALEEPAPITPTADSLELLALDRSPLASPEDSSELVARPLFWQERRPLAVADSRLQPAEQQEAPGELKDVAVLGVFGSGESAGIIAKVKKKQRRVLVGESLAGWTLDSVGSNKAVLRNGARRVELLLNLLPVAAPVAEAAQAAGKPEADTNARLAQAAARASGSTEAAATKQKKNARKKEKKPKPRRLTLGGQISQ